MVRELRALLGLSGPIWVAHPIPETGVANQDRRPRRPHSVPARVFGYSLRMEATVPVNAAVGRPSRAPAFVMGLGLGGFVDGIVLHQILQWHHMLTDAGEPADTVAGLEANTLADGFFHLATWLLVAGGMVLLVRAWRRGELAPPWRLHVGMLLVGWGVFNLVEGVVDHQLLGIHHVRDDLGAPLGWDLGFLAFGVLLVFVGWVLAHLANRPGGPAAAMPSNGR